MQKSKIAITAGLLILAGSAAAIAAVGDSGWRGERWGGRHHGGNLMRMDANKDGTLTLEEFVGRREGRFAELDANKDGALSPEEIVAPMRERVAFRDKRMLKALDADNDGKVSKAEFEARTRERFADRDLDSDGKITRDDMPPRWKHRGDRGDRGDRRAEAEQGSPEAGQEGRGKGRRLGRGPMTLDRMLERTTGRFQDLDKNADGFVDAQELAGSHEEMIAYQVKKLMHRLDKDTDGKVTKDEYTARAKTRFANLDLDGDGKITAADMPPGMAKRWGKSRE